MGLQDKENSGFGERHTKDFFAAMNEGKLSTEEALAVFDGLDAVETEFMLGAWEGAGFPTGHPLDGVMEICFWHGKSFESLENVHPLIFSTICGGKRSLNPTLLMPGLGLVDRLPFLKSKIIGRFFQLLIPFFVTRRPRARLRLTGYRGKSSATMIYDNLPVNDVFRKVDEHTVLGVMDIRGMERPFFFVLRRETDKAAATDP